MGCNLIPSIANWRVVSIGAPKDKYRTNDSSKLQHTAWTWRRRAVQMQGQRDSIYRPLTLANRGAYQIRSIVTDRVWTQLKHLES